MSRLAGRAGVERERGCSLACHHLNWGGRPLYRDLAAPRCGCTSRALATISPATDIQPTDTARSYNSLPGSGQDELPGGAIFVNTEGVEGTARNSKYHSHSQSVHS